MVGSTVVAGARDKNSKFKLLLLLFNSMALRLWYTEYGTQIMVHVSCMANARVDKLQTLLVLQGRGQFNDHDTNFNN